MKMIEIVMLAGTQCISPVQHTGHATEVAKVQCAVVIETDSAAGTLRILPAAASNRPEVVAVLQRIASDAQATRIEPAAALPRQQPQAPVQTQAQGEAVVPPAAAAPEAAPPAPEKAAPGKSEAKVPEAAKKKTADADKSASKCRGEAKPKWYKAADGRRKYRCVRAG